MANLWLFDIDGTLVNINHVHIDSYKSAYHDILRKEVSDVTIKSQFGKSEYDIHTYLLNALGIRPDNHLIDKLTEAFKLNSIKALSGLEKIEPLKGVVEFLTHLQICHEVLGAVTGNLKAPADVILEKAGIINFFKIFSYSDGTKTREQIVQHVIDEAIKQKYNFNKVIVIGDTIHDVEAGKYLNAFTVAVATGSDSLKKLEEAKPDIAVPTLVNYQLILKQLNQAQ